MISQPFPSSPFQPYVVHFSPKPLQLINMTFHLPFLLLALLLASTAKATINPSLSCNQTPYPELCNSMVSTTNLANENNAQVDFRELAIRTTLARAELAHQIASQIDTSSLDQPAKTAWADCLELCEDTIAHLNRSLSQTCTHDDSQTWLSAAIANQQTCRNGFLELNSSFHYPSSPFLSHNISNAVSNLLAINKAASAAAAASAGGNRKLLSMISNDGSRFPAWVSGADRKLLQSSTVNADLVVAKDGSGNYKTISEAVAASANKRSGSSRFVIYVKAGTYNELVEITASMKNLMIVGDGIDQTVVTGSKNVADGSTTFRSATFAVVGNGFIARDITFENTAGPQKHQAVALRSGSDLSVFYRCSFKGYQDTLYVYSQRQFYRNCDVYGTVDFIFGDAAVVLQNCNIYARKPMSGQTNTVTAQGRTDPNENTGISIHNSVIAAASDLGAVKSYLGRPWQKYSRTVIMKTNIGSLIDAAGWLEWSGDFALSTLYYGEYLNTGAGSGTSGRVNWAGYHVITSASEAGKFTVGSFISGDSWIQATGVPYTSGL